MIYIRRLLTLCIAATETKICHNANIEVIGATGGCRHDNRRATSDYKFGIMTTFLSLHIQYITYTLRWRHSECDGD